MVLDLWYNMFLAGDMFREHTEQMWRSCYSSVLLQISQETSRQTQSQGAS